MTLPGDLMRGRHTLAILKMMGIEETIAASKDEYVQMAIRLGQDSQYRQYISQQIAENKHKLYGDLKPVRALEVFLMQLVQRDMNTSDNRESIYHDLHGQQLSQQDHQNRHSAKIILNILFRDFKPQSVLDVGCGLGTWLSVCKELGVQEIQGIDGKWLDTNLLNIPESCVLKVDLEQPFQLRRKFNLAICLEVAEHLHQEAAEGFIKSLTSHADRILFSAAIPYQGGHHHVNEQWPDYWNTLFMKHGYCALDFIRGEIWQDSSVLWWLKQNILLFVKTELIEQNENWKIAAKIKSPLSIVHPNVYESRLKSAFSEKNDYQQLLNVLSSGGFFSVKTGNNGQISITKIRD